MSERTWTAASGYRYGFNGKEKDDEFSVQDGSYDFGARMYDARLGRWWSVDAYYAKNVSQSNYSFGRNSCILFVDEGGNDNCIYLVVTERARQGLADKKISVEDVVAQANEFLGNLGLLTKVVLFQGTPEDIDINLIEDTDAIAVMGFDIMETREFIATELDENFGFELNGWNESDRNPEKSENNSVEPNDPKGGEIIAISIDNIEFYSFSWNRLSLDKPEDEYQRADVMEKVLGLTIIHGAGHNADLNHAYEKAHKPNQSRVMYDGDRMGDFAGGASSLRKLGFGKDGYTDPTKNQDYINYMIDRFNALSTHCNVFEDE